MRPKLFSSDIVGGDGLRVCHQVVVVYTFPTHSTVCLRELFYSYHSEM